MNDINDKRLSEALVQAASVVMRNNPGMSMNQAMAIAYSALDKILDYSRMEALEDEEEVRLQSDLNDAAKYAKQDLRFIDKKEHAFENEIASFEDESLQKSRNFFERILDKTRNDKESVVNFVLKAKDAWESEENQVYKKAIEALIKEKVLTIPAVQEKLQMGYDKAHKVMKKIEEEGLVQPVQKMESVINKPSRTDRLMYILIGLSIAVVLLLLGVFLLLAFN